MTLGSLHSAVIDYREESILAASVVIIESILASTGFSLELRRYIFVLDL